jgi:DNA-binding MarR family transcriptional regulator
MLAELNLTYPQFLVMVMLWERQGLGMKDIAARLQQDPGSVTPLVKRLEAQGYISRSRDPRDERNMVLSLTPAGEALREAGARVGQAIADNCSLQLEEYTRMMADIAKLNKKLG